MNWWENVKIALQSVRANLLRSILTMLIIAFGIMALVGILTAIDAAIYSLNDNLSELGANAFQIRPAREDGPRGNRGGRRIKQGAEISYRQAMAFKDRFTFPSKVSMSFIGTSLATVNYREEQTNPNVPVKGIDEYFLNINGYDLLLGRGFSETELESGTPRALIGMDIVDALFDEIPERALNQTITVDNIRLKVIGILASKGASQGASEDRIVMAPLTLVKRYYGTQKTNFDLVVAVRTAEDMEPASGMATGLFRNIRRLRIGQADDFSIRQSDSLLKIIRENTANLQLAAAAIGWITLLGAAIGLMNIMLVSVTERTKEIGISKAVGATRRTVLMQFLTEAVVICQLGGLLGVFFGIIIGNMVAIFLEGNFLIPWMWILTGILTCFFVGILSGLYPALKASRLDPIESLRYE
ncbi:MAG: ABC transporter permease [Bacteroidota bacterium]